MQRRFADAEWMPVLGVFNHRRVKSFEVEEGLSNLKDGKTPGFF